jgi:hypothetical protein
MEYFGYFTDQERYEAEQEMNEWYRVIDEIIQDEQEETSEVIE